MSAALRPAGAHVAKSRLLKLLVIKSAFDLLFIGALAVSYDLRVFNPYLRGWLDEANGEWASGWVIDQATRDAQVEVQLYVDNNFIDSQLATQPRPDLVRAGVVRADKHGFLFFMPPLAPGAHEARVFAVYQGAEGNRRALHLIGQPKRFTTENLAAAPYFRGWLDEANQTSVRGWVVNTAAYSAPVEVQLYLDGRLVERRQTDQARKDLLAAGITGDGKHGFFFFTPPLAPGEHEARVFAVQPAAAAGQGQTLRLIGRPVRFNVNTGVIIQPQGVPVEEDSLP